MVLVASELPNERYWFIGNCFFEQKKSRRNRLIVNFRYSNGVEKVNSNIFLNKGIVVPTEPISPESVSFIDEVVSRCSIDEQLRQYPLRIFAARFDVSGIEHMQTIYPGLEVILTDAKKHVFQIEIPNEDAIEQRLPKQFQTGMHDLTFRYDNDWLLRKASVCQTLEEVLVDRERVDFIVDEARQIADSYRGDRKRLEKEIVRFLGEGFASGAVDLDVKNRRRFPNLARFVSDGTYFSEQRKLRDLIAELRTIQPRANTALRQLDPKNEFSYNSESEDFEVYLHSENGFSVDGGRLSEEELRHQVGVHYDIETCMFRYPHEERDLQRRELLADLASGKFDRVRRVVRDLEEQASKNISSKKKEGIVREIEYLNRVLQFSSVDLNAELGKVERDLTINVAGYDISLFDQVYADRVHVFPVRFELPDGKVIRELHTLVDPKLKEVNGYRVIVHEDSRDLHNCITRLRRKYRSFREINHKIDFDIIHSRDDALLAGAEPHDSIVRGKKPGKDVSIADFYIRLRQNALYQDTFRGLFNEIPFNEGHTLEDYVEYHVGIGVFKKPEGVYKLLRDWYVLASKGDVDAARKLADYATKDVDADAISEKRSNQLGRTLRALELAPFLTPTQALFSPALWRKAHELRYWREMHCHRDYGIEQKLENDRKQIFDKRFPAILRDKLRSFGINTSPMPGVYSEVMQVYFPLEFLLRDKIVQVDDRWAEFFDKLPDDNIERFATLRYAWAFLSRVLEDYNSTMNADVRLGNKLKRVNLPVLEVHNLLDRFVSNADVHDFDKAVFMQEVLRADYRSVYPLLRKEDRAVARAPRVTKAKWQQEFGFTDFREIDQADLTRLRENAPKIIAHYSKGVKYMLSRFMTNFSTNVRLLTNLSGYAFGLSDSIPEEKIVYMAILREERRRRGNEFESFYGIRADAEDWRDSFRFDVRLAMRQLADDLKKSKSCVVDSRLNGRYLFLEGGDAASGKYDSLLPLRVLRNYRVGDNELIDKNQLEMFDHAAVSVPETTAEFII
jgi:hypothetical protein